MNPSSSASRACRCPELPRRLLPEADTRGEVAKERLKFLFLKRPTTRAPANVPCVGDGSPALRDTGVSCEERRGPPRLRGRPLRTCCGRTPRRIPPPPCPHNTHAGGCCCLRCIPERSASGKHKFRGRSPTARTFACLRIADGISATVARLATGRAGSPCTIKEELSSGSNELDVGDPLARSAPGSPHLECQPRTCTRARETVGYLW